MIQEIKKIDIGDTVKMNYRFTEKDKQRVQAFTGVVIAKKGAGVSATMTLRGDASGVMMEKIIPLNSPNIQKIEILKKSKVRRSKLYYLRDVVGKRAKLKRKIEKKESQE